MTATFERLRQRDRERLEKLLRGRWSPPGEHPLRALHGQRLGDARLMVVLGPRNAVGSRYFHLFLVDSGGRLGSPALALGLFNTGPFPAYNWLELTRYDPLQTFDGQRLDLAGEALDAPLFRLLSAFVPAGGHLMVEYDSPGQRASERVLTLGYPPAASPLGYLLFQAGCRSYRDWYISEGGREGPRKLQGFRPLNQDIALEKSERLRRQLEEFLARPAGGRESEWEHLARENARRVLRELEVEGQGSAARG